MDALLRWAFGISDFFMCTLLGELNYIEKLSTVLCNIRQINVLSIYLSIRIIWIHGFIGYLALSLPFQITYMSS